MDLETRWAYVLDFEGDELTESWSPKTESSVRAVALHPLVARALERVEPVPRPDGSESPWVFPISDRRKRRRLKNKHGHTLPVYGDRRSPETSYFSDKLRQAMAAAKIERSVTIHGLRRTFAVLLQEAGAPDSVIRQALGHGQRGVTELNYLPRRDPLLQRWVDAIPMHIAALGPPAQSKTGGSHCPQSATSSVADRPPYLRLVD